ncbi:ATP-binding cassette domain-containing protein [Streptomyces sp. BR1]|uniref:ATP-binding cassette domain-containing protein n=1 Tax=Streptomyces sp. BR1 TaxID=1592323 RepID=UPI00402B2BE5
MPVFRAVTDAGTTADAAGAPSVPLVGRDGELDQLVRLLTDGRRTSRVAVVEGTAGIGKTRLLAAVGERAASAGREVLRAAATPADTDVPYGLLMHALYHTPALDLLEEFGEQPVEAPSQRHRRRRRLRDALLENADRTPVVLVLDDLQWADEESLRLLEHLLRGPSDQRLGFVLAHRSGGCPPWLARTLGDAAALRIVLGPLGPPDAALLVPAAPPGRERQLVAAGRGNPRQLRVLHSLTAGLAADLADELAAELASGDPRSMGLLDGWHPDPDLLGEFDSLSARARAVLQAAAVAGAEFDPALVAEVAVLPERRVGIALDELAAGRTFTLAMPVTVLIAQRFMKEAGLAQENYLGAQSRIADGLVAALAGVRTIRAAGTLATETDRVLEPLPELSAAGSAMWRTERDVVWRMGLLLPLTDVLVLAVAGLAVADGRLGPAGLLAVTGYLALASGMVEEIDALLGIAQARAAARRLGEVFRHEPPSGGAESTTPADGAVRLRGVTVRHAGEPVLERLDLNLPAGTAVALVGRTGAGKSVLAGLLGRLTDPDEGEISIGGVPVRDLPLDRLRTLVVHAFERPELYGRTVHEAISFGRPGVGREDVVRAARAAQADRFVRRLPAGYDTPLDETPLSGGERQRLGLARTLLRPALVHVLDDATSGLDTATEAEVSRCVTDLLAGRTRLVVAHRAATAARCDFVAWLDGGRIRAFGPHGLLWADPDYRAVFGPAGATGSLADPDAVQKEPDPMKKEDERCRVEHR